MKKTLLIALALTAFTALPAAAEEPSALTTEVSMEQAETVITAKGRTVRVQNGQGENLRIFNITGVEIATMPVDSQDKTFTLNLGRGCYIIQVGNTVRKITIQ